MLNYYSFIRGLIGKPTVGKPFLGLEGLVGLDFWAVLRAPVAISAWNVCEKHAKPRESRRKPVGMDENPRESAKICDSSQKTGFPTVGFQMKSLLEIRFRVVVQCRRFDWVPVPRLVPHPSETREG